MWQRFNYYLDLIRFKKPIGTYLLLWPTLAALWLAAGGFPGFKLLFIFALGTFAMRSAGCAINDIADRQLDNQVKRTKARPLTSGKITLFEAFMVLLFFCVIALILVLQLNQLSLLLAFVALGLTLIYPFTKRWIDAPQLILGFAFATSIPMAFAAVSDTLPPLCWAFYFVALIWPVTYDTMYGMVDKEDDLRVGMKSTAILFGRFDKLIVALLQFIILLVLIGIGLWQQFNFFYYLGLLGTATLFVYQQMLIKNRQRDTCFKAFLNNHWALFCVFVGVVLAFWS